MPQPELRAWSPFETLADFEYTETAILGLLPKWIIDKQLAGFNSKWAKGSRLTIKTFAEMDNVLTKARKYFVQVSESQLPSPFLIHSDIFDQFKTDVVTATYEGEVYEFTFDYRDPWEWILSIIQDKSLAPTSMWNAVRKYYCSGEFEERIYDELNTADTWWNIDVSTSSVNLRRLCAVLIFDL